MLTVSGFAVAETVELYTHTHTHFVLKEIRKQYGDLSNHSLKYQTVLMKRGHKRYTYAYHTIMTGLRRIQCYGLFCQTNCIFFQCLEDP